MRRLTTAAVLSIVLLPVYGMSLGKYQPGSIKVLVDGRSQRQLPKAFGIRGSRCGSKSKGRSRRDVRPDRGRPVWERVGPRIDPLIALCGD